ncbi:MAG: hypothetical protein ABL907_20105 [Hyphomicrobium sp.]
MTGRKRALTWKKLGLLLALDVMLGIAGLSFTGVAFTGLAIPDVAVAEDPANPSAPPAGTAMQDGAPPQPATATPSEPPAAEAAPEAPAVAAAGPKAETAAPDAKAAAAVPPVPQEPVKVTVGIYVNDIQDIDFRTNSYTVDLYIWFRWNSKSIDPIKTMEFMNAYDPSNEKRTVLLDEAKVMPDGSLYNIIRYQGRFSTKFRFETYPFDTQTLEFVVEDSVSPASVQYFAADTRAITINPKMVLPGYQFGTPLMTTAPYNYPTDFGDLSVESAESYSRVTVGVPITRPMFTLAIKTFVPILLIVICATLVFFINPHFVEGRIGLAITALLTLVAIQFTAAASLPDADYFTMLDKLYMLSYAFIIAALLRVVVTSWKGAAAGLPEDIAISAGDHWWGMALLVVYAIAAAMIAGWVLVR